MSNVETLYSLLKKGKVVIPLIQRDYAQGRKEKVFVLSQFLNDIKEHFDQNKPLFLDFVYGSKRDDCFQPLDGQQRLSTLWLLHWYISLMSGHLNEDKELLSNFSYETRSASREFCSSLCLKFDESGYDKSVNIVDYIKSQNWFYSVWLQDPTIGSMLRSLGGDSVSQNDSIASVFSDVDFEDYRSKLLPGNSFISFKTLYIGTEQLPVSDDLYIKINARGKQLTHFENFKADLLDWIKRNGAEENDYILYSSYLDNEWTQVFWNCLKERCGTANFNGNVDTPFLAFLNRYFLCLHCIKSSVPSSSFKGENDKDFTLLYGYLSRSKETKRVELKYEKFDPYGNCLDISDLDLIGTIITNIKSEENTFSAQWIESLINQTNSYDSDEVSSEADDYSFIPKYEETEDENDSQKYIRRTTLKELIYFWGVCKFLSQGSNITNSEYAFKEWVRMLRNLIENSKVENVSAMVECLRYVDEFANKCKQSYAWDVIKCMSEQQPNSGDSALDRQVIEEIYKANIILNHPEKKDLICEAENYSFFNGTISFLLLDEQSNIDYQLTNFETKYNTAKTLFNVDSKQSVSFDTLKKFLLLFNSFSELIDKYIYTSVGYHNRNSCWKNTILCSRDLATYVHKLLMDETIITTTPTFAFNNYNHILKKVYDDPENYEYRYFEQYGLKYIHKKYSSNQLIYLGTNRKATCDIINSLITNNQISLVDPNENCYLDGYYWGKKLLISFSNRVFCITQESEQNVDFSVLYTYVEENLKDKLGRFSTEQELLALLNQ